MTIREDGIALGITGHRQFAVEAKTVPPLAQALSDAVLKHGAKDAVFIMADGTVSAKAPEMIVGNWFSVVPSQSGMVTLSRFAMGRSAKFDSLQLAPDNAMTMGLLLKDVSSLTQKLTPAEIVAANHGPVIRGPQAMLELRNPALKRTTPPPVELRETTLDEEIRIADQAARNTAQKIEGPR